MSTTVKNAAFFAVPMILVAGAWLYAGPLNPPAGPIGSTGKTLNEVEPGIVVNSTNTPGDADSIYKITQPGRYILDRDLVGGAGRHGIEIEASNVTLDMRGYTLRGVAGSLSGIDANGTGPGSPTSAPYVTLKNGLITGWGSNGVTGNNAGAWVVEEVKFASNTGTGISINSGTVFTRCYFYLNSLDGCQTSNHVEFHECFASQNGGHGYAAGSDSGFVNCEAGSNGGSGFVVPLGGRAVNCTSTLNTVGIFFGDGGSVDNCHVDDNRNEGIIVGKGGTVTRCAVEGNGTAGSFSGIYARLFASSSLTTATVSDCIVTGSTGRGIYIAGGTIRSCVADSNGATGIQMSGSGTISACTARSNTGSGITGGQSVAILDNTSSSNTTHGIVVNDDCRVRGNTCDGNGSAIADGAGIYVSDDPIILNSNSDNRIEENNCTDNDRGIWVDDGGNLVIRNTCSGNGSNFEITATNNRWGTIVNITGANPVTVSGNNAASTMASTDPWANFAY